MRSVMCKASLKALKTVREDVAAVRIHQVMPLKLIGPPTPVITLRQMLNPQLRLITF